MAAPTTLLKQTPLYEVHVALGARMTGFAGFDMPVQYSGIIDEHLAVRQAAGLFDVSHMGEVFVRGPQALAYVQHLVTNDAAKLYDGKAMYTVMCQNDGGVVDDLLVYRLTENDYLLVINASNIDKDLAWMKANNPMGADLVNVSEEIALLAVQGPKAIAITQKLTDVPLEALKYYHFIQPVSGRFLGCTHAIVSRTGYTGETGLEIYCEAESAETVWNALMEAGQDQGIKPAGLGARDTLRLEAGFCLYGNDLTEATNPYEARLGWITKLDKGDFVGREALRQVKLAGPERKLIGFVMEQRSIPRQGYAILNPEGAEIGVVTSGSHSPMLGQGIGLGYVPNDPVYTEPGAALVISVRGRPLPARVVQPPFHKK